MSRLATTFLCFLAVARTMHGETGLDLHVPVEGQPLSANITRVLQAFHFLGAPLPGEATKRLQAAAEAQDADRLQELLDPLVLLVVTINPESRVKVQRGPAEARLQQAGFTPVLVKVINQSALTRELRIVSPQSGQVYAGMTPLSAQRMQRTQLKETSETNAVPGRFLEAEMYSRPPLTPNLSGLAAEYVIALIYSGEHHIHGAGCAHYSSPTEGVTPEDMFVQVNGEGLNVGCVLTWGPCFDYQRRFFTPAVHQLSGPLSLMKYDLEISGFGSQALGHVCLLNLKEQTFPGSEGTKDKAWPTWTTPVMKWAKAQGAVTGYAHSASGLEIDARDATRRLFLRFDSNQDRLLVRTECANALLPLPFDAIDTDHDAALSESELIAAHDRAAEQLPNLAVPQMNGVGAMEICVSVAAGWCDFISAMDTPRIAEWNMWYHLLNCGFPLKVSGETDFPCMSGERVGQGRVYVQLGRVKQIDFGSWCHGLAQGRSYVSDGFAHALAFTVNGTAPGFDDLHLAAPGKVRIRSKVVFAPELPRAVAQGMIVPPDGKRFVGDTVTLHGPRTDEVIGGGQRLIEIVVNGKAVATKEVLADGQAHDWNLEIEIHQSAWVALRHFPQLHTNPVHVLVGGKPIRAARTDALWCIETIEQLWRTRKGAIAESERAEARRTFDEAIEKF